MVVVAAIDCGSNSTRLLISEVNNGKLKKLFKTHKVTKTSQGLQESGRISNDSKKQLFNTLRNYLKLIKEYEADHILCIGTAVFRDAENSNEIKSAIDERKIFIIRTAILVAIVILVFSIVLNRFFLKPIGNLVDYTKIIKSKSDKKTKIENLKKRKDELGILTNSLEDMTQELQNRVNTAENFSTDLVHEIRNPLASLKSASEIISETDDKNQRDKLVNILSHDVERIERLITDYSQMLKDEVAITKEQMNKIDLKEIVNSVVDDFNSIYLPKRGIKISLEINNQYKKFEIYGIENRIEQILANLLENSISFSEDNKEIIVKLSKDKNKKITLDVIDEGIGFKEKDTSKIFKRFYSNRPEKFGEHSGLGLNIVKNLIELHGGKIIAGNNLNKKGAKIEIIFPNA